MVASRDYRKPRNQEMRDLVLQLPHPIRVLDHQDALLWQNRAAEDLPEQTVWTKQSISWQGQRAILAVAQARQPEPSPELLELRAENERLRRHQKQTARRKKKAEDSARQTEKLAEKFAKQERKLRERVQAAEQAQQELKVQLAEQTELAEQAAALRPPPDAFEGKPNPLAAQLEAAAARYVDLQSEFDAYRQEVEEEESQRLLEEQLSAKVRELEELERSFEDEQTAFLQQKRDLEARLTEQEVEFVRLRDTVSGATSSRATSGDDQLAVLQEEIQHARAALAESGRREARLNEKLDTTQELKDEQGKVLTLVKDELRELRQREKDLRDTLRLYGDFRGDLEQARSEAKRYREEVSTLREASEKLEARLIQSQRELSEATSVSGGLSLRRPSSPSAADSASDTVKSQFELAQSRLRQTEKKLDEARAALKKAQADAVTAKETEKLAFQDGLTGLPNRHIVDRFLDFSHKQARSNGQNYALFLIDVDGFRVLNDTFGRDWGDALLKAVAERLAGMRGKNHVVARHGQDRFLLLVGELMANSVTSFVADAARALLDALAHPFEVKGETIKLTGSLGISVGPGRGDDHKNLLPQAETALENAKSLGPGTYVIYNDALAQKTQRDQMYLRQMEHAIAREEFQNVYQPVFSLKKGMVTGLELLLRWHHRDQRVLKPEEFLDVALRSGLIFAIAEVTWPKAFKALARWRRLRPGITLSINLSDRELLNPRLVERATEWASAAGVEPSAILFEVRDASRLRNSSSWWTILSALQRAGFGLVLDDYAAKSSLFGTLAFSGFVQAKTTVDEKNPVCTPAPAAHKSVEYVAKRIQTRFDPKLLRKAGFDLAQGSAVAQPLEENDVDDILS